MSETVMLHAIIIVVLLLLGIRGGWLAGLGMAARIDFSKTSFARYVGELLGILAAMILMGVFLIHSHR